MSKSKIKKILQELKHGLSEILGERLEAVYLYGSHARGEAWAGSDVDVLILIRGEFDFYSLMDTTSDLAWELSLENDVVISRVFMPAEKYWNGKTPFILNIQCEAISF
ncbi:MAG: hypothetical protein A2Z16_14630 [Chloroflexi bacterium RBG_16_54_18]|nr:MAG: hypothetical protein A2Z16_14630 [Chloroflexi bacterium RBG_16_54_18]